MKDINSGSLQLKDSFSQLMTLWFSQKMEYICWLWEKNQVELSKMSMD